MSDSTTIPAATDQTVPTEKDTTLSGNEPARHASERIRGESIRIWATGRLMTAIGLQMFILVGMALLWLLAAAAHDYDFPIPSAEDFANFDFIGVGPDNPEPSFMAVALEVLLWSAFGVMARSEYYITRLIIQRQDFRTLETVSKLIGDSAMGIAMAIAAVALLRSTEFVTLSLRSAGIDVIAPISFILGFYHEDTYRLLGTFRQSVARGAGERAENEDAV